MAKKKKARKAKKARKGMSKAARRKAGKKAAATRARKKAMRSAAAKKGARRKARKGGSRKGKRRAAEAMEKPRKKKGKKGGRKGSKKGRRKGKRQDLATQLTNAKMRIATIEQRYADKHRLLQDRILKAAGLEKERLRVKLSKLEAERGKELARKNKQIATLQAAEKGKRRSKGRKGKRKGAKRNPIGSGGGHEWGATALGVFLGLVFTIGPYRALRSHSLGTSGGGAGGVDAPVQGDVPNLLTGQLPLWSRLKWKGLIAILTVGTVDIALPFVAAAYTDSDFWKTMWQTWGVTGSVLAGAKVTTDVAALAMKKHPHRPADVRSREHGARRARPVGRRAAAGDQRRSRPRSAGAHGLRSRARRLRARRSRRCLLRSVRRQERQGSPPGLSARHRTGNHRHDSTAGGPEHPRRASAQPGAEHGQHGLAEPRGAQRLLASHQHGRRRRHPHQQVRAEEPLRQQEPLRHLRRFRGARTALREARDSPTQ